MKKTFFTLAALGAVLLACTAGEDSPTSGSYTIQFPSTAAAIATDAVTITVFPVTDPAQAPTICDDMILARTRGDRPVAEFSNSAAPVNICEMLNGLRPVTLSYGQKAVMAVALRKSNNNYNDFLIGCTVQTIGDGDFKLSVPVALVDVASAVPDPGDCNSVGDYCNKLCKPN